MTYQEACKKAQEVSASQACTQHVMATIGVPYGKEPYVIPDAYLLSDWYDRSVVNTFTCGKSDR